MITSQLPAEWSVGLKLEDLEDMLCHRIPKVTGEDDGLHYAGLASRCQSSGLSVCKAELSCAAIWLSTVLDGPFSQLLSPSEVAEIHSFIGLIKEVHGNYDLACQSYVKALWIASQACAPQNKNFTKDQLAVILCRLGNAYGRSGNYEQMQYLLDKAVEINDKKVVRRRSRSSSRRLLSFRWTRGPASTDLDC
jgi:tetratricopeptide (TPR) repeat protein